MQAMAVAVAVTAAVTGGGLHFAGSTFAKVFVTVLVIMDPLASVSVFLAMTSADTPHRQHEAAAQASLLAGGVILAFAVFGQGILKVLGIDLAALQVAGGLLLALVALELLHPTNSDDEVPKDHNVALVPLGTPLLAGPGAIVATMYYMRAATNWSQTLSVVAALVAVIAVTFITLRFSAVIARLLRPSAISVVTRILGLLVTAIAVQLVAGGIIAIAHTAHT